MLILFKNVYTQAVLLELSIEKEIKNKNKPKRQRNAPRCVQ